MVSETGVNTPALRAESVDMYLDTAQFLKVEDINGQSIIEEEDDDIKEVEEAVSEEGEEEDKDTALEVADEEEEE
jgi:hypothetical protein